MIRKYLLDTNVLVDLLRGKAGLGIQQLMDIGIDHCAISDITVFELFCGAAASSFPERKYTAIENLLAKIDILPLQDIYREAARQKVALQKAGIPIEDFDLFIGCTALCDGRTLLTGNRKHMERIQGLQVEEWKGSYGRNDGLGR